MEPQELTLLQRILIIGLGLFLAALLSNFTGYLLPWDQLAFWAITICTGMLDTFLEFRLLRILGLKKAKIQKVLDFWSKFGKQNSGFSFRH